jgi:hypothetical protein
MYRLAILLILLVACHTQKTETAPDIAATVSTSECGGYGYTIHLNGKLFLNQPCMPALNGVQGFPTKETARQAAELVISKIRKGQLPPALSINEINGILNPAESDLPARR